MTSSTKQIETIRWQIAQWFELRWWKNYLQGKDKKTYYEWKKKYWKDLLEKISINPILPNETVADIGCGPAGIFILFEQNKVFAADPLLDFYEKELSFFQKSDFPNVEFSNFSMEYLNTCFQYDRVFCMNAINHVSEIECAFEQLAGITKKELVVSIDAHNFSFFKYLFRLIPGDILHPHQYDLEEYKQFLLKNNIEIVQCVCLKKEFFFSHYVLVGVKKQY